MTEPSPVSYAGEHYAVDDAYLEPKPLANPHPPVLVGGGGEQLTLRAVAEHADRWNVPMADPETYEHKLGVLADHCEAVGRDYEAIEKTVLARALLRETTDEAHEVYEQRVPQAESTGRDEYRGLVGTDEDAARVVEQFRDIGAEMVMVAAPRERPGDDRPTRR